MKKLYLSLLTLVLMFGLAGQIYALDGRDIEKIYYTDGSYATIETKVFSQELSRGTSSRNAQKTFTHKRGSQVLWKFTLNATFTYDGSKATASKSTVTSSISDKAWSCDNKSTSRSGSTAYGDASFSCATASKDVSLSLTCDKNGNIS